MDLVAVTMDLVAVTMDLVAVTMDLVAVTVLQALAYHRVTRAFFP
jgi:hypothetical protein